MPCRIHSTVNRTCEHDQLSLPWLGYICGKRSFAHITKTPVISRLQVNEKGDSPGWAWSSQDEHLEDRELWNERGSLLALKRQKTIFWTAYRNGWPLRAEDLSPIATRSWIPPATWVNERGLSSRGGCFPANILVVGLWHPEQETQLDYAQTPDPQKLWDN